MAIRGTSEILLSATQKSGWRLLILEANRITCTHVFHQSSTGLCQEWSSWVALSDMMSTDSSPHLDLPCHSEGREIYSRLKSSFKDFKVHKMIQVINWY